MPPETTGSAGQDRITDSAATERICDGSVVCLAQMHMERCRSQMGFAELAAEESNDELRLLWRRSRLMDPLKRILGGLDEGYRLLGPVGFVSAAALFVLVLAVLAHA